MRTRGALPAAVRMGLPLTLSLSLFANMVVQAQASAQEPAQAVANSVNLSVQSAQEALGRRLFYEGDLSLDGSMACSTCHEQRHGFASRQPTHPGVTGDAGHRNVPGLANVGMRKRFNWADPLMASLEEQAFTPLFGAHPVEMGMAGKEAEMASRLSSNACYVQLFSNAFPDQGGVITTATITQALAQFQRSLISVNSPYDQWLDGNENALSQVQKRGLATFQTQCASCHTGRDTTDDAFHSVSKNAKDGADLGVFAVTGIETDKGKFRTPSLRNASISAPYFHDGQSPDLKAAIARHDTIVLAKDDTALLIEFLQSLTDEEFTRAAKHAFPQGGCP